MASNKLNLCLFMCIGSCAMRGRASTNDENRGESPLDIGNFAHAYSESIQQTFPKVGEWINKLVFKEKCLEGLGCFSNGPPFYHPLLRPLSVLPFDLKDMNTKFYLYTSKHERTLLEPNDESFSQALYNKSMGLQIFIHGFKIQFTPDVLASTEELIDAIMKGSHQNVILVDWTASNKGPYVQAVANGRVVGAQVAQLVEYLQKTAGLDPKETHLIGHSLGTHVTGWAGERIPNLGRITGLDPAGPYFQYGEPSIRLDHTDADFVDIIHTNAADVVVQGLGIVEAIGHVDFYVNGGTVQPGCEATLLNLTVGGITIKIVGNKDGPIKNFPSIMCNHVRALDLYIESTDNSKCKFIGSECPDYQKYKWGRCKRNTKAEMGFFAKKNQDVTPGSKFYLTTSGERPYCIPN